MNTPYIDLARLFQSVTGVLEQERETLNQADSANGNHGEHMVEIFRLATQAARDQAGAGLAEGMEYGGQLLREQSDNGSAQVYSRGLSAFARAFRDYQVSLADLVAYVRHLVWDKNDVGTSASQPESGEVLKALVNGLADWQQAEINQTQPGKNVNMGYLFELGMAYMQARQRGGSQLEILADAAASASPLNNIPHRYESGKLAILALLQAMTSQDGQE